MGSTTPKRIGLATYEHAWTRVGGLQRQILELARAFGDRAALPPDLVETDVLHIFGLNFGLYGFLDHRGPLVWSPILAQPILPMRQVARHVRDSVRLLPGSWGLTQGLLNRADGFVCLSERERRWIQRVAPETAAVVVGNAGDHVLRVESIELESPLDGPYLLMLGSLVPRKGQLDLIRASSSWPADVRLVVVGQDLDPDYAAQCRKAAIGSRATILPNQSLGSVRWLLEHAQALIISSTGEGVPLVAHEAHVLGTPVLYRNALLQMGELPWTVAVSDLGDAPRLVARAREVVEIGRAQDTWAARASELDVFYMEVLASIA